ncbi:MAG: hypothetical protein JJT90_12330 [Ectothiorhodospiraceae bacterium]|nr:hypothetical protein [Ectothiorhodospiraceae bacterium]
MTMWTCSVASSALKDARVSLGKLADETWHVEADSREEALEKVKADIIERRPMTMLPADLLDDWLVADEDQG